MPQFNLHNASMPLQNGNVPGDFAQGLQRTARKRSRDEADDNLTPDEPPPKVEENPDEWVYGEGMVLIKPNVGYVADASSQSGTWKEEKEADEDRLRQQKELNMADLRNNKSQRLDLSGTNPFTNPEVLGRPLPGMPVVSPKASPVIDDCTVHLGIGWSKITDEGPLHAAAKGWARFIENHYPLTSVKIRLESKGLQSYLIESDQGYFLFAEDLRQGRLVSQDVEVAMRHLQRNPPTFDGANAILPSETPSSYANGADADVSMS